MAMIANQTPPAPPVADYRHRVIVKFRADLRLPYSRDAADALAKLADRRWSELAAAQPGLALVPYFSLDAAILRDLAQRASPAGQPPPAFTSYYAVECPPGTDLEAFARTLATWPEVETAYVEAGPTPPPLDPSDDPRSASQGYLDAAPAGIDARWMWNLADGSGIGFVDLERGWTLAHEDLAAAGIAIISGLSQDFHGHGTAVLGEAVAVDNTRGGIGIAPGATARVVSQWRTASNYNTAEAILSAVGAMNAGDVLLLEAQTSWPTASGYVPVEVEQAAFDAIQFATSQGIVVVEAGANGAVDLDAFQDLAGKRILNRGSPDFRDSGAIMVGAASSAAPHTRLGFSNHGSRIDCFAWGQNIDTSGDGWTGTGTNTYTTSFGGTSGASPIVSGAALLLQAWRVNRGEARYTPAELRTLLSDPARNTASADPPNDRIGVMPDLRAIARGRFAWRPWLLVLAWAWLLLLGALLITPGGVLCIKCGPADPGYLGDTVINVLGLVAVALGAAGLIDRARRGSR